MKAFAGEDGDDSQVLGAVVMAMSACPGGGARVDSLKRGHRQCPSCISISSRSSLRRVAGTYEVATSSCSSTSGDGNANGGLRWWWSTCREVLPGASRRSSSAAARPEQGCG